MRGGHAAGGVLLRSTHCNGYGNTYCTRTLWTKYVYAHPILEFQSVDVAVVATLSNSGEGHDWTAVCRAGRSVINLRELKVEPPSGADVHEPLIYSLGDRYQVQ